MEGSHVLRFGSRKIPEGTLQGQEEGAWLISFVMKTQVLMRRIKLGGLSGPRGAKSGKATDDVKDKSDAVEGASKDEAEKNLPEDRTVEKMVLCLKGECLME